MLPHIEQKVTHTKNNLTGQNQNTFHKAFCKTGINPEGLIWVTLKTTHNMTIAKTHMQ